MVVSSLHSCLHVIGRVWQRITIIFMHTYSSINPLSLLTGCITSSYILCFLCLKKLTICSVYRLSLSFWLFSRRQCASVMSYYRYRLPLVTLCLRRRSVWYGKRMQCESLCDRDFNNEMHVRWVCSLLSALTLLSCEPAWLVATLCFILCVDARGIADYITLACKNLIYSHHMHIRM
jgi:hypothetical protein